ncbi:MAG: DNA primase catalytic subunit PriS [Candidatus Thermoplasmatota archaeon]|nr:DNA primase catalytic subunit PriS [Candidatus Thermoplasmatota archaeon]MBS3790214.1 DNA primase catalytic subunit PriS [Candidatus Thermoplasmatota archaeon]
MKGSDKTRRFLSRVLRDYYSTIDPSLPYRFTMREFAFVYFDSDGMHRPVAFRSKADVKEFLREKTPLHSYYSTAYYSNPQAPMAEKEWLGADLVFDLDADHIPGSENLNYIEQLEKVKEKCILLINDFLMDDFGFEKEDIELYFSGHRGYHVHVRKDKVLSLSNQARREIVDYITGVGLDLDVILPYENIKIGQYKDIDNIKKTPRLPDKDEGGWRKKTRKLTSELLKRWNEMKKDEVIKEMEEKHGIGTKTASGLYRNLFEEGKWKKIIRDGVLDVFSEDRRMVNVSTFKKIIEGILKEENVQEIGSQIIGSTDEPVTGDTKRLIRLPNSIHGGSFLVVQKITLDSLEEFDPLNNAVPDFLTDKEYEIRFGDLPRIESISVKDERFEIQKEMTIPEFASPFFVQKLGAKLL